MEAAKQLVDAESCSAHTELSPQPKLKSEYTQLYHQFFQDIRLTQAEIDKINHDMLHQEEIVYCPHHFEPEFKIHITRYSPDFRVAVLIVLLGHFQVTLWVYNDDTQSPFHYCTSVPARQNTSIYFVSYGDSSEAVKCYEFNKVETPVSVFVRALKECCFLKIASVVGVGPKFTKICQFDLILFGNCVEFGMERCSQLSHCLEQITEREVAALKRKILKLHHMKMIHLDIKPGNIMFSNSLKQPVFIDFGFSTMVQEPLGYKSATYCAGTLEYSSYQMRIALVQREEALKHIDLYYNDIHCLQVSLSEMQAGLTHENGSIIQSDQEQVFTFKSSVDYIEYKLILGIKKYAYLNKNIVEKAEYRQFLRKNYHKLYDFFINLPFCLCLLQLHSFMISEFGVREDQRKDWQVLVHYKMDKMFKLEQPYVESENLFLRKLELSSQEAEIVLSLHGKVRIICFKDYKSKLGDPLQIAKLQKHQYYQLILQCLDFRCSLSTIEQKEAYSSIFLRVEKLNADLKEVQPSYRPIAMVFKHLLNHFLLTQEQHFQTVIPATLCNLVILDALTKQQMYEAMDRISKLAAHPLDIAVLMFKCSEVLLWINLKIYSIYKDLDLQIYILDTLYQKLKEVRRSQYKILALIIKDTICYDKQLLSQSTDDLVQYLSFFKGIDYEVLQDLISVTIYERNRMMLGYKVINHTNAIMNLYMINHKIFTRSKIKPIHLQILLNSSHKSHQDIRKRVNQQLADCLQDQKLIQQFRQFYYNCGFLLSTKDSFQKVQKLLAISGNKSFSYSTQFLMAFKNLAFEERDDSQQKQIIEASKALFNLRYLQELTLPPNKKYTNFQSLFTNITLIFLLFFWIYRKQDCPEMNFLTILMEKLRDYWKDIQCLPCKQVCYHRIKKIEMLSCLSHQRYEQVSEICLAEIEKIADQDQIQMMKMQALGMYLEILLSVLQKNPPKKLNFLQFTRKLYRIIKTKAIFQIVFIFQTNHLVYAFLTDHILQTEPFPQHQFLFFHRNLTNFLHFYPQKDFLKFYHQALITCFRVYRNLLGFYAESIVAEYLKLQGQLNSFIALVLSYLLQLLPKESPYLRKAAIKVCQHAEISMSFIKYQALQNFFSDCLVLLELLGEERRRRKLLFYLRYIKAKMSFLRFQELIGLKKIRKDTKSGLFSQKLIQKLKYLYKNSSQ